MARRPRLAPWLPLATLIMVAASLWVAAEFNATSPLLPRLTSEGRPHPVSFGLCAVVSSPNCVIDGDTIRHHGVKIRLADIDAPEVQSPKCASERERGERATRRLLELMNGGPVQMARYDSRDEDVYGRKLRVIARDGRSLGGILVAEGLARPWDGARRSWCG